MRLFNLHTHTCFSDGSDEPEDYIKEAIEQNFSSLGFSDHAPLSYENNFSMRYDEMANYCKRILYLQKKYKKQIDIFLSLEIDFIPGISRSFSEFKKHCLLDYTIGSVHLVRNKNKKNLWFIDGPKAEIYAQGLKDVFNGDIRKGVKTYYDQINKMIITQKPDIIGHIDKIRMNNKNRYFSENEEWYKKLVSKTLNIVVNSDSIIEVNTRGIYKKQSDTLFPNIEVLKQIYMLDIPITLSSDAHSTSELSAYFDEAINILKDIGFKYLFVYKPNGFGKIRL